MLLEPKFHSNHQLTLDDIRPHLVNAKQRGQEIVCACPVCEANDPRGHHLYISLNRDNLLMTCHKNGCDFKSIVQTFRDGGAKHTSDIMVAPVDHGKVIENINYCYKFPDGRVAYYKNRQKYEDGHKEFRFFYMDQHNQKVYKKPNEANLLYNLDKLYNAYPSDVLYIVEGEKCADRMTEKGLLATTSNTGARGSMKFTETDLALLNKFPRRIVIPDNDEKGMEYVNAFPGAEVMRMTEIWPDCPRKGDIADYIDNDLPMDVVIKWKPYDFSQEAINNMSATDLMNVDFLHGVFKITDPLERQGVLALISIRAGDLGNKKPINDFIKVFEKEISGKRSKKGNIQQFSCNPPVKNLCCGEWIADMEGVRRIVKTAEDDTDAEYASYIPITPSAILKNIENCTEKMALSFYTDETWHTINVQRSLVANNNKIIELADLGVDVNSGTAKALVKYLADVVNNNDTKTLPRLSTVSHLGWVEDKFIPYDDEVVTDIGTDFMDTVNAVSESGDLEEWVEFVKPLRKNIYLRVALATSFSSPIVSKVNALPYVLMLYGGSGTGKTVALQVAASIWGDPNMGKLVKSLNNTINYTMNTLGMLKHLPFLGDELQTIREKFGSYDDLLYRVTEGLDRGRMNSNSVVQKTNSWSNCMIFTGEEDCVKSMSGGGVANRVISVECREKVIDDGHAVSSFVKYHYGCAGREYIEALKKYDLLEEYRKIYKELSQTAASTEKQTMAMTMIMLGDKISSECIFYDDPLTAEEIRGFLKSAAEVDVAERAYNWVCDFISEHIANFEEGAQIVWGKNYRGYIYINKTVLDREMSAAGFDFNAVKHRWADRGHLQKLSGNKFSEQYSISGKKTNCVLLKC